MRRARSRLLCEAIPTPNSNSISYMALKLRMVCSQSGFLCTHGFSSLNRKNDTTQLATTVIHVLLPQQFLINYQSQMFCALFAESWVRSSTSPLLHLKLTCFFLALLKIRLLFVQYSEARLTDT